MEGLGREHELSELIRLVLCDVFLDKVGLTGMRDWARRLELAWEWHRASPGDPWARDEYEAVRDERLPKCVAWMLGMGEDVTMLSFVRCMIVKAFDSATWEQALQEPARLLALLEPFQLDHILAKSTLRGLFSLAVLQQPINLQLLLSVLNLRKWRHLMLFVKLLLDGSLVPDLGRAAAHFRHVCEGLGAYVARLRAQPAEVRAAWLARLQPLEGLELALEDVAFGMPDWGAEPGGELAFGILVRLVEAAAFETRGQLETQLQDLGVPEDLAGRILDSQERLQAGRACRAWDGGLPEAVAAQLATLSQAAGSSPARLPAADRLVLLLERYGCVLSFWCSPDCQALEDGWQPLRELAAQLAAHLERVCQAEPCDPDAPGQCVTSWHRGTGRTQSFEDYEPDPDFDIVAEVAVEQQRAAQRAAAQLAAGRRSVLQWAEQTGEERAEQWLQGVATETVCRGTLRRSVRAHAAGLGFAEREIELCCALASDRFTLSALRLLFEHEAAEYHALCQQQRQPRQGRDAAAAAQRDAVARQAAALRAQRVCSNDQCGATSTSEWCTHPNTGQPLCRACHDWRRRYGTERPARVAQAAAQQAQPVCSNDQCGATSTGKWCTHPNTGQPLCRACYEWHRRHGTERPARVAQAAARRRGS